MKMPKIVTILFCYVLFVNVLHAQDSDTIRFTLEEAIAYGLEHDADLRLAAMDVTKAEKDVKITTASGLPQINASARYTNYPALPAQLIPAEFFGGQPGEFIPVRFGTEHNLRAAVDLNQMIFDGRFFQGLRAASAYVDLTERQLDRTAIDTRFQISTAYYAAQVAQENLRILRENVKSVNRLYNETKALYDNGFVESIEVDRVALTKTNVESRLKSAQRQLVLSLALLKFQMGMDVTTPLQLEESLEDMTKKEPALLTATIDPSSTIDYQVLELQQELGQINKKNIQAGYYPSLYFFGTIETQAQRPELDFLDGDKRWFGAGYLGLTLNIPIWDSFEKANKIQKQEVSLRQIQVQQEQLANGVRLELIESKNNYADALEQMADQEANLELAQKIYNIATTKYNEGVGSSLEVNNAQTTLYQTQTAYINALYRVMVAKASLEKVLEKQ